MSLFHFKQFSVSHSQSTMKVGTDAVLLGAWMPLPENCKTILEIGSGCGVIALMLAQRTNANITGIDIDKESVIEAKKNAENSPWKNNVQFYHENVQFFAQTNIEKFDVIVSNPPFFENSLKSPNRNKNISKHTDMLSFENLAGAVNILLSNTGCFGVILPMNCVEKFEKIMFFFHLYIIKKKLIYPTPAKKANRMLMLFERKPAACQEEKLTIRENGYTSEYLELVKEYLILK